MIDSIYTEKKATNLLLRRGVKVPILAPLFFRMLGKEVFEFQLTAPTANTLLLIADKYLSMNIEKDDDLSLPEAFTLLKNHSKAVTDIIAIAILNNEKKMWRMKFLSRLLSSRLKQEELDYLFHLIVVAGGLEDFISTIRLVRSMRITKPMNLSPEEEMS